MSSLLDESGLLRVALKACQAETGISLVISRQQVEMNGYRADAVIETPHNENPLAAVTKKWAAQANLGVLVDQVRRCPIECMLVADYINPNMAKKLKVAGVQFIDTAGNVYLNRPPLYAYVSGNKPPKETLNQASRVTHVFDAAGLKVIFGFLCDLELVNKSYRDIAARTDVALGTVSRVLASLKESGYLIDQGKKQGRVLVNRSRLLEKWVEAYPQKLRPKYLIGEFIGEDPYWWKDFEIEPSEALWGGEVAAAKYVDYLKPQAVTIYLFGNTENQFLANARMRKPVGDNSEKSALVTIYRAFWNKSLISSIQQPGLAHPLLVYADLISTGDSRNLETARMIYEQFINEYIRED